VINLGCKADLGRLEWIVGGERNREEENASGIRRITLDDEWVTMSHYRPMG